MSSSEKSLWSDDFTPDAKDYGGFKRKMINGMARCIRKKSLVLGLFLYVNVVLFVIISQRQDGKFNTVNSKASDESFVLSFTAGAIRVVDFHVKTGMALNSRNRNIAKVSKAIHQHLNLSLVPSQANAENITFTTSFYNTVHKKLLDIKQIDIIYNNFSLVEPHFATANDRQMFYKNIVYQKDLTTNRVSQQLRGIVALQKNAVAYEKIDCGWKNNLSDYYPKDKYQPTSVYRGVLCPLLVPDSYAFQHFIDGVLPKLMQVYDFVINHNVAFLILKPRDPIIYEMYEALGIDRNRLVYYEGKPIRVETMINTCIAPPIHSSLWKAARKALVMSAPETISKNTIQVVLLHRVKTANGGRKILNLEEVTDYLFRRYGQTSVTIVTGEMSLNDSLKLFQKTKLILGVHGGALYNLLFAPQQTTIVELMPTLESGQIQPPTLGHEIIWFQAQLLGQKYWRLPVIPSNTQSDMNVPIERLDHLLQQIDSNSKLNLL